MITIKQDSELMTNLVAANPVPAGSRFVAFKDAKLNPAIFSLGEDQKLNLIIDVDGTSSLVDFGDVSGLAKGNTDVLAFDVQQAPDLSLNICFVTATGNGQCDFWLLHGLTPDGLLKEPAETKIIKGTGLPLVYHIFMSDLKTDTASTLPLVFVAFQPVNRIMREEQLGLVEIVSTNGGSTVSVNKSWTLATNPRRIIDVAFGTCRLGDGAFVLYETASGKKVQFKVFRGPGAGFVVEPQCPAGATCLTAFIDPKTKQSILLTGGDVISVLTSKEYVSPKGTARNIVTQSSSMRLKDIHVSQAGDNLRIWYTTTSDAVYYYTTKISSMLSLRTLNKRKTAVVSSLLSVDERGNIILLQQDSQLNMWQRYPIYHASLVNTIEIKGYTMRIQTDVSNDAGESNQQDLPTIIPKCWLFVRSSGVICCLINGRSSILSTTGNWFQTDVNGVLNIIFATNDASCHKVYVDLFRPDGDDTVKVLDAPPLDPSRKVVSKLDNIQSGSDLLAARTQNGKPLLGSDVSADDADKAVEALGLLAKKLRQLDQQDTERLAASKAALRSQTLAAHSLPEFWFWDDVVDALSDAWHWVEENVEEAWDWIGVSFEKLMEFLGFLFQWDDIVDTADSLATCFNVGLEYGQQLLNEADVNVQSWLENTRKPLKEQLASLIDNSLTDIKVGLNSFSSMPTSRLQSSANEKNSPVEFKSGVAYNWMSYQFMYGGGTNAQMRSSSSAESNDQIIGKLWLDIKKELETMETLARNLVDDFISFFEGGSFDLKSLLQKITADIVDAIMDSLETISDVLFKTLSLAMGVVKELGNTVIDVPIISQLWSLITGGRPLILVNCCSLLVAVPTTIVYKAVAQKVPPKLKGRLTEDTFQQYVETGTVSGDSTLPADIQSFGMAAVVGLGGVYREVVLASILVGSVSGGLGLVFASMNQKAPFHTFLEIPDSVGNVIDSVSLIFECGGLFFSWPLRYETEKFQFVDVCRWGVWLLDLVNALAIVGTRTVGAMEGIKRVTSKRWRGTIAAATCFPALLMELAVAIEDYGPRNFTAAQFTRHIIEAVATFGSQAGFAAAAWSDQLNNPITYIGLGVYGACTVLALGLKIYDFIEEQNERHTAEKD
ncbi:hypothetical protein VTN77DRAFT_3480 [Rasamsonia byssochlamydoides]|uniref:uncharacterized protein n=1 Tax=Rasamsonia byssochlamydoides TaxID=89139 RepID=UPI0037438F99